MNRNRIHMICCLSLLACLAPVGASEVPRYGAADFVPTPETPIGFRADGNGWYPGATPPAQWWEGTPTQIMLRISRGQNDRYNPERDKNSKQVSVWDLADRQSKNILWKMPLPGWGDAQPIVVGSRVIVCTGPDITTCYDSATGKVLWQNELKAMHLPVLGDDRKMIGPSPAPVQAEREQLAWELALATYMLRLHPLDAALERAQQWRAAMSPELPAPVLGAMDEMIAAMKAVKAAEDPKSLPERTERWFNIYPGAVAKQLRTTVAAGWTGHVGFSFSTPVSDGKTVVVAFMNGLVGAYDVASGKRVWAWRDPVVPDNMHMNHAPSPLLHGDTVIVRSGDGHALMGLDKDTGAVRWETEVRKNKRGTPQSHGNYITPLLIDVPVVGGGTRRVLLTQEPPILDPVTGKELGRLEIIGRKGRSDRGNIVGRDGIVFSSWGYDATPSPVYAMRLRFEKDQFKVEFLHNLQTGRFAGESKIYVPGQLIGAGAFHDPVTGAQILDSSLPLVNEVGNVLAGDIQISRDGQNSFHRRREDFRVIVAYATEQTQAKPPGSSLLSDINLLDGSDLPADRVFDTHLKGLDKKLNIGCYHGLPAWFGTRVGGVVPHGNRLFIQSVSALYCIGPEALGSPKDDPQVVAAINAVSDLPTLAKHLGGERPHYRYLALNRLRSLKLPLDEATRQRVIELSNTDVFEEIRAAAVLALDASDPATLPGWQALLAKHTAVQNGFDRYKLDAVLALRNHNLTLRALGGAYLSQRIGAVAANDPATLRNWLDLAGRAEPLPTNAVDRALVVSEGGVQYRDERLQQAALAVLLRALDTDPRTLTAIRTGKGFAPATRLYALYNRLPAGQLPAFLAEQLRAPGDLGYEWWSTSNPVARICRRLGPDQVVPVLEKAAADRPEIAEKLQGLISWLKQPMLNPLPEAQEP